MARDKAPGGARGGSSKRDRDGLYQRDGVYWLQWRDTRRSLRTRDRQIAKRAAQAIQLAAADPTHAAQDKAAQARLSDWVTRLLAAKKAGRSAGTLHFYRVKCGHVLRVWGEDALLSEVTPGRVDEFITQRLGEGAEPYTISKELTAIVQICKRAKRAGEYTGDISALRPPDFDPEYTPREGVLLPEHEPALRAVCTPEQWGAICFTLGTGARLAEILRAQPGDIDFERQEVKMRGSKTAASRDTIPIVEVAGLAGYLRQAVLPVDWRRMSGDLPRLCEKAGIPKLTPNDLRRTTSTRLIEAGVDPYDAIKVTRHTTLAMLLKVYDRARVSATRQRIEAAGARMASESAAAATGTKPVRSPKRKKGDTTDSSTIT